MAVTETPRLGITEWSDPDDPFTRAQLEHDHEQLENLVAIDLQGTLAARPAAGIRGRYYYATDNGIVYRDNGATWTSTVAAGPIAGDTTTQAFGDAASNGSSGRSADAQHRHGMPANPVTAHVAAGDPHPAYALDTDLAASQRATPARYAPRFLLMGA